MILLLCLICCLFCVLVLLSFGFWFDCSLVLFNLIVCGLGDACWFYIGIWFDYVSLYCFDFILVCCFVLFCCALMFVCFVGCGFWGIRLANSVGFTWCYMGLLVSDCVYAYCLLFTFGYCLAFVLAFFVCLILLLVTLVNFDICFGVSCLLWLLFDISFVIWLRFASGYCCACVCMVLRFISLCY